jgi:hypothetical protein
MGTSNSNKGTRGSGTPLIPTWLNGGNGQDASENPSENNSENNSPIPQSPIPTNIPPIPPAGDPDRFKAPRTNFSQFVSSGGKRSSHLGRAVSGYISHSAGGSTNATRSMKSSRVAGGRLLNFLTSVSREGVQQTLRSLKLESLVGSAIENIFLGLTDFICPEGGTLDAGIARDAFIQTIADLAGSGISDLNTLNQDQINTLFEIYTTHSIEAKILNEIGSKTIVLSKNISDAEKIQKQLHDFINNGVADALIELRSSLKNLTSNRIQGFVDAVYEKAFTFLITLGSLEEE